MITHPKKCPHCGYDKEPWLTTSLEHDDLVWDCCGKIEVLTPSHYKLMFGKYQGLTLGEMTDEWYLGFLNKMAEEKGDGLLLRVLALKK